MTDQDTHQRIAAERRARDTEVLAAVFAGTILSTAVVGTLAGFVRGSWQAQAGWVILSGVVAFFVLLLLTMVLVPVVKRTGLSYRRFVEWR